MTEKAGILYMVATPIGNLGDITARALETLKTVDTILSEDTRVTGNLLRHFEIKKPLISFHEHTENDKAQKLIERMVAGESMALVTDAGTPGISDPGNVLVEMAVFAGMRVVPIPGANALGAIVSVAGINMREFMFLGFPPHKKGRETFFKKVVSSEYPVVYYESPHRVLKNLELLGSFDPETKVVLGRELTKIFEEVVRGTVGEVKTYFTEHREKIKGEFVIIAY
ncbi:MAG: 16S rRNA (cytidine(1402)-2'-O)-methyltransferase [Candidatus Moranbacteria bacterium CG_4_9_14_3_um_filter_45_14]|nr:MAG: 16S rRNA (cytidine(1402)-2'-O)-methyltransferase [Candidatus Moranbacteria bacterium CG_4_9_14_3_um_filter_45_14]